MATRSRTVQKIPVEFGSVSIGDQAASIGITIDRHNLTVSRADELLCGRRLTGKIESKPKDEDADLGEEGGAESNGDGE